MSIYPDYSTGQSHWFSGLSLSGAIALRPTAGSGQRRPRAWGGTVLAALGSTGGRGTREESLEKRLIFHGKMGGYIGKHQGEIMNSALSDGKHGKVSGNKLLFSLFEGNGQFICNGYFMILQQVFSSPGWIAGRYVLVDNSGIQGGAKQAETVLAKLDTQDWKTLKGVGGGGLGRSLLHESTLLIILRITDRVMQVSTATLLNLRGALLGCFWIMRPSFDQRDTLATGHRTYTVHYIYTYIHTYVYIYINTMWTDLER